MAVLCEGISVVIRAGRVLDAFGTFGAFRAAVPNGTLASDNELVRVGFMNPDDVRAFVGVLERRGLTYIEAGEAVDLAVIDQVRGPMVPAPWLEFGQVGIPAGKVSVVRLVGTTVDQMYTPQGWAYEGSLSQRFGEILSAGASMAFIRHEAGVDFYRNLDTGEEVQVGRISGTKRN